ncbi:glycosyltransferase family 2 protein [Brumimicrobium mesophilum]|uniref:glycosyltransferase family 2 protein n=1 Tax=Brumimicrobium mesophilum TaxID=392717 RepID=UPI000D13EF27|nr:glycosyltransferase family 2 protein [Brumimicrobium mesophilum]
MKNNSNFTIVLPCYNPILGWEKTVIHAVEELQQKLAITIDLIIVNDGSTQNVTSKEVNALKSAIPQINFVSYEENKGKGYALREGVKQVKNFPIVYTDIDFPYTTVSFIGVYEEIISGKYDAVLGKRDHSYYQNTPFVRKIISKTLRGSFKYFLSLPTDDTQCGIKAFNENGANVFLTTEIKRFLFDLEFVKLISKRKLTYKTVLVNLKPNIVFSSVNPKILAKESLNFVKVLFRK